MRNILQDLYFGRLSGWERRPSRTAEFKAINRKIAAEKTYFTEQMSVDDCERFEALENLYTQSHQADEADAFCLGFRLGAMIIGAVFMDEGCGEKQQSGESAER